MQTFHYGSSDSQVGDIYLPDAPRPAVVCLLHGGFWRMPYGREETAPIAVDLAARGYAAWNIEYRRVGAPGGGWPGTLDDVVAAIEHLAVLNAGAVEVDLERIAVVGHSAGGQLALGACARGRARAGIGRGKVFPKAAAALAGVVDLHRAFVLGCGNGAVGSLLGGSPDQYPDRYAQASPPSLVPLGVRQLILQGTQDDAVPADLAREYVRAARSAGDDVDYVEMAGMGHMEYLDPASEAHAALCHWLGKVLARAAI